MANRKVSALTTSKTTFDRIKNIQVFLNTYENDITRNLNKNVTTFYYQRAIMTKV